MCNQNIISNKFDLNLSTTLSSQYIFKSRMSLANSKIRQTWTQQFFFTSLKNEFKKKVGCHCRKQKMKMRHEYFKAVFFMRNFQLVSVVSLMREKIICTSSRASLNYVYVTHLANYLQQKFHVIIIVIIWKNFWSFKFSEKIGHFEKFLLSRVHVINIASMPSKIECWTLSETFYIERKCSCFFKKSPFFSFSISLRLY